MYPRAALRVFDGARPLVARETASSLMAAVMKVLPSMTSSHILAKFGAPPDPTKPLESFRSDFSQKASVWEATQDAGETRDRRCAPSPSNR